MITNHMKPEDVAPYIRKQMEGMSAESIRRFHRVAIGPTMLTMVIAAFLAATGPNRSKWVSRAKETKFNGRFSAAYNKRPSGREVEAGSVRNVDTGDLANAHVVIKADSKEVIVGPSSKKKDKKARDIMSRESSYGNYAVGWDDRRIRILFHEVKAFFDEIAEGKTPRYLPRSKIRTQI